MDIFERLTSRIDRLPDGAAKVGLGAVKLHIGTAIRHLERGEASADETAFTDAILRCNHAFEGSVKEAYRVLAGHDPKAKTPAFIESYMREGDFLRKKVLAQFENYRKEWRNPSTHDYLLDFDANEALLAIVSVTVFAVVLCDQIRGKLAFNSASASGHPGSDIRPDTPLMDVVRSAVKRFASAATAGDIPDYHLELETVDDALAGFLIGEWSDQPAIEVLYQADVAILGEEESTYADVLVRRHDETVAIETRGRDRLADRGKMIATQRMLENMLAAKSITGGIIFLVDPNHNYDDVSNEAEDLSDTVFVVG